MSKLSDTRRDRSRRPESKLADMSRRHARRAKSTLQFLCIAFPPEGGTFGSARA